MTDFIFFNKKIEIDENRPAIVGKGGIISYAELVRRAGGYSALLKAMGLKKGSHAAILSGNNPEFIILLLALWNIGAVPVPLNLRLLDLDLERLIRHSKAEFVFVHEELKDRLKSEIKKIIFPFTQDELTNKASFIQCEESGNPDELALILYTSGTTGNPKGVMHSFSTLFYSATASDVLLRQTNMDSWLASLPFYHIGGFSIPVRALLFGACVAIPDSLKSEDIALAIETFRPTLTSFVTTTLRRLLEMGVKPNKELRFMLLGGGPVDDALAEDALRENWKAVKVYGSTETATLVTALEVGKNTRKLSSVGKALPGNRIIIVDEYGHEVPKGKSGEIAIQGPSLMKGYWENPEETSKSLKEGFYYTGDLGHLDSEGYLYVEARRTDLIISGGENVNPLEVEAAILRYGKVKDACVFALEDRQWGQRVAAALVKDGDFQPEELDSFLRGHLAAYKVPRRIFFLDELPRTSLGKLRRDYIREMFKFK
ncbi:MAG: o-succinylbenzoate--CoA ligase [Ignavibacteria bacterium]|jgi:O-succinylbenzoic acid--CoA ligase|nr:o-succinylbenzoate--CoA ligase [Ignavibacteria bacterium]MCU7504135.1 o-succinylbenzoate--CoA ligase [Ignavibacteria bacterium]MCU7516415.1 o-succinylbenzoate--CoA ligase [Ignavibacteria bacterium]